MAGLIKLGLKDIAGEGGFGSFGSEYESVTECCEYCNERCGFIEVWIILTS